MARPRSGRRERRRGAIAAASAKETTCRRSRNRSGPRSAAAAATRTRDDAGQAADLQEGREAQGGDGRDPRRDRLGARGERRGVRQEATSRRAANDGRPLPAPGREVPIGANPSFFDLVDARRDPTPCRQRPPAEDAAPSIPHGTTVLGMKFDGGVIIAGDRRATDGYAIADDRDGEGLRGRRLLGDRDRRRGRPGDRDRRACSSSSSSTTRRSRATGSRWRARRTGSAR